jgi:hypothetical protein
MQQRGIPSPKGKTQWNRTTVWGLLHNATYLGKAQFDKTRFKKKSRPFFGFPDHVDRIDMPMTQRNPVSPE